MIKIIFLLITLFVIPFISVSQISDIEINNLKENSVNLIKSGRSDSAILLIKNKLLPLYKKDSKVYLELLINYSIAHVNLKKYNKALQLYHYIDSVAKVTNEVKIRAKANYNTGSIYSNLNKYAKAILYLDKAKELFLSINDSLYYGITLRNKGLCYKKTNDLNTSIKEYHKALKVFEQINYKEGQARIFESLGILYRKIQEYKLSIQNHKQAIDFYKNNTKNKRLTKSLLNIAVVYITINNPDTATQYLKRALAIAETNQNTKYIGMISENWGELAYNEKDYKLATQKLDRALKAYFKVDYERGIINVQTWQAQVLLTTNKLKEANIKINKSLQTLAKTNYPESEQMALNTLRDLRLKEKNYKAAYETMYKIYRLADSLHKIRKAEAVLNANVLYETKITQGKNKQLEAKNLTKQLKIENLTKQILIIVLLFILTILGSLWYFYYSRLKKKQLILQKNAEALRVIRHEKDKISMELHDLIGGEIFGMLLQYQIIGSEIEDDQITQANEEFGKVYNKIRGYSRSLKNIDSKNIALEVSILNLVHRFEASSEVRFETNVASYDWTELSPNTKSNIYYIVQESVLNAIKYSEADKIEILFIKKKKQYNFSIIDNGKGFDQAKVQNPNGLDNIKERVLEINGEVKIETKEGKGTNINIQIKHK